MEVPFRKFSGKTLPSPVRILVVLTDNRSKHFVSVAARPNVPGAMDSEGVLFGVFLRDILQNS
jgi:hypothetical protein